MTNDSTTHLCPQTGPSVRATWAFLLAIFAIVYFAAIFTPPLMDDVDSTHAQAAQYFAENSDWITAKVDGIRYIEKPPLPYWTVAIVFHLFGENVFSAHLPNVLGMLALAWLAWYWTRQGWGPRAGLYAGMAVLTSIGPFLFTRFIIPEAILSLLLLFTLYCLLTGLEWDRPNRFYWMWAALALGVLTKGLIAPVFFVGAAVPYLLLTGQWRRWRRLKPLTGPLLFLAIAAPWHILCGLANPDQGHAVGNHPTIGNVHGFFYFYFINEHVLRFFSLRYPHDYNKLPQSIYWLGHVVWLFPWSLFLPAVLALAWKTRRRWLQHLRPDAGQTVDFYLDYATREDVATYSARVKFRVRTMWLLSLFTGWTLVFFAISSNQEYYTFPVWTPLFILIAAVVAGIEEKGGTGRDAADEPLLSRKWLTGGHAVFTAIGVTSAMALAWGLRVSRGIPPADDIGTLLAHRGVADYTLSMSHLFDLTGAAFASLRLPAVLAAIALLVGPAAGWVLRQRRRDMAATISVGLTAAVFLIAAHIAFARFDPMLGSKRMADTIIRYGAPTDRLIVYGEQSEASSVIFYTHNFLHSYALMVCPRCGQHAENPPMLWGSCYPDAPDIFLDNEKLSRMWGTGTRKWLFAEDVNRAKVEQLLGKRLYHVQSLADKELWTDRPLP